MSEKSNPYRSSGVNETPEKQPERGDQTSDSRQAYNTFTDTVTGANVRMKDNVFQAIAIVVCMLIGAAVGAIFVEERIPGAVTGALIGMVVGLFGSGIYLMIYRAVRHIKGKHD